MKNKNKIEHYHYLIYSDKINADISKGEEKYWREGDIVEAPASILKSRVLSKFKQSHPNFKDIIQISEKDALAKVEEYKKPLHVISNDYNNGGKIEEAINVVNKVWGAINLNNREKALLRDVVLFYIEKGTFPKTKINKKEIDKYERLEEKGVIVISNKREEYPVVYLTQIEEQEVECALGNDSVDFEHGGAMNSYNNIVKYVYGLSNMNVARMYNQRTRINIQPEEVTAEIRNDLADMIYLEPQNYQDGGEIKTILEMPDSERIDFIEQTIKEDPFYTEEKGSFRLIAEKANEIAENFFHINKSNPLTIKGDTVYFEPDKRMIKREGYLKAQAKYAAHFVTIKTEDKKRRFYADHKIGATQNIIKTLENPIDRLLQNENGKESIVYIGELELNNYCCMILAIIKDDNGALSIITLYPEKTLEYIQKKKASGFWSDAPFSNPTEKSSSDRVVSGTNDDINDSRTQSKDSNNSDNSIKMQRGGHLNWLQLIESQGEKIYEYQTEEAYWHKGSGTTIRYDYNGVIYEITTWHDDVEDHTPGEKTLAVEIKKGEEVPYYVTPDGEPIVYLDDIEWRWMKNNKWRAELNKKADQKKKEYEKAKWSKRPQDTKRRIDWLNKQWKLKDEVEKAQEEAEKVKITVWQIVPKGMQLIHDQQGNKYQLNEVQKMLLDKHYKNIYEMEKGGQTQREEDKSLIFYVHDSGDPSVGIFPFYSEIKISDDLKWDEEMFEAFRHSLADFYDVRNEQVLNEAQYIQNEIEEIEMGIDMSEAEIEAEDLDKKTIESILKSNDRDKARVKELKSIYNKVRLKYKYDRKSPAKGHIIEVIKGEFAGKKGVIVDTPYTNSSIIKIDDKKVSKFNNEFLTIDDSGRRMEKGGKAFDNQVSYIITGTHPI